MSLGTCKSPAHELMIKCFHQREIPVYPHFKIFEVRQGNNILQVAICDCEISEETRNSQVLSDANGSANHIYLLIGLGHLLSEPLESQHPTLHKQRVSRRCSTKTCAHLIISQRNKEMIENTNADRIQC